MSNKGWGDVAGGKQECMGFSGPFLISLQGDTLIDLDRPSHLPIHKSSHCSTLLLYDDPPGGQDFSLIYLTTVDLSIPTLNPASCLNLFLFIPDPWIIVFSQLCNQQMLLSIC